MNIAQIITLILQAISQLLPLVEQLKQLATTTTVSTEAMAAIDAQLRAAHDRLGALIDAGDGANANR